MQFVDEVDIYIKAGDGGNGIVAFRREKYRPRGGPAGGDGGKGGDVILQGDFKLNTLVDLRYKRHYKADRGGDGGPNDRHGKNGKDLTIRVPLGTIAVNKKTGRAVADITEDGQQVVIAKGGEGGRGNASFATSRVQTPRFAEKGEPTDEKEFSLELKLLADIGLVGFPNVGKSTLISKISAAKPKIADYPFTTLVPNLGVVSVDQNRSFVVADIPGLIEGAHTGAGLGHQFLKHVERTRLLVHLIDVSGMTDRDARRDFEAINRELAAHSERLASLKQVVAINKVDVCSDSSLIADIRRDLEGRGYEVCEISAVSGQGTDKLVYRLADLLDEIPKEDVVPAQDVVIFTIDEEDEEWDVEKTGEHEFVIIGRKPEMIVKRTDTTNEYALRRMHRKLDKLGVMKRLKQMGAAHGDSVRICDLEFDYHDEAYEQDF